MKAKMPAQNETSSEVFNKGETVLLPLNRIGKHPKMAYRKADAEHVASLKVSIQSEGLKNPLLVWNGGTADSMMKVKEGTFPASWLVAGVHRLAAIHSIAKESPEVFKKLFPGGVPCRVDGGDFKAALLTQLIENVARREVSVTEVLPVMVLLRDEHKMKGAAIAAKIGKSPAWVSQVFSVKDNVDDETLGEMAEGGVSMNTAVDTAKIIKKAKESGEEIAPKAALEKAKEAAAAPEKKVVRVKAEILWKRYTTLPQMDTSAKLTILEKAFKYLAGVIQTLPKELSKD